MFHPVAFSPNDGGNRGRERAAHLLELRAGVSRNHVRKLAHRIRRFAVQLLVLFPQHIFNDLEGAACGKSDRREPSLCPATITLDIDDTCDPAHGRQQWYSSPS